MSSAPDCLNALLAKQFCELAHSLGDSDAPVDFSNAQEDIERWHNAICEPVDPKVAKYAKAVTRIIGETATMFFAVQYKDAVALRRNDAITSIAPIPASDSADRARVWRTLHVMTMLGYAYHTMEPPRVPSPKDIESNIQQFRASKRAHGGKSSGKSGVGPMQRAFYDKLLETADLLPPQPRKALVERLHSIPVESHAQLSLSWSADPFQRRGEPFGKDVLTNADVQAFESVSEWSRVEAALRQLNDLSRVQKNIPTNMLSHIESYATDLAGKITSGDADLSNLNLQTIGEDVLKHCSEEDINGLANNIGSLLPALGSLQATVTQQAGLPADVAANPAMASAMASLLTATASAASAP